MVLLGKRPPKGRRLLILSTTSNRSMLTDMDLMDSFASDIRVPSVHSLPQLEKVLQDVELFPNANELQRAMHLLHQAGYGEEGKLSLGIKKLLSMAEMCRQDPDDVAGRLVQLVMES